MAVKFDTLRYAQALQAGGFTESQASASAAALGMVLEESIPVTLGDLATKDALLDTRLALSKDIAQVREDLSRDIAQVREDLSKDIAQVREDLSRDIAQVREDLSRDIAQVREDLSREISGLQVGISDIRGDIRKLHWMFGIMLAGIGTLMAAAGAQLVKQLM